MTGTMDNMDAVVEAARRAALSGERFVAQLDEDLLSLEEDIEGAVRTRDVVAVGRVWHFESIDEFWQAWALDQTPEMSNMLATFRSARLPMVAACLAAITGRDGIRRPVTELFKPPAKDKALAEMFTRNPLAQQQWVRKQIIIWLRNGSKNTGRSQQQGALVERLYEEGVIKVQEAQRRALTSIDPFFNELWAESLSESDPSSESSTPSSSDSSTAQTTPPNTDPAQSQSKVASAQSSNAL
jgi:hypothetical protein